MAHLVDDKAIGEDKNMEIDDTSDARFASILHSRALVSDNHFTTAYILIMFPIAVLHT